MGFQRTYSRSDLELLSARGREQARRSFWAYRQLLYPNMIKGWFQREVARELMEFWEAMKRGERPILLIEAPPQHGKSRQAVEFVSWVAGQDPDLKAIYASFSDNLGARANRDLQRIYDLPRYQETFPGTRINSQNTVTVSSQALRNSTLLQYLGREGQFMNTTVQGQITGQGMDFGVIDDPIKGRAEANSLTTRNRAWDWLMDDFMTRLSKNAGILGIMTRWHVDDPFGRLKERMPKVREIKFPAIAEASDAFRKKGEALFPEHKPLDFLLERKSTMASGSWEALYQQNPTIPEGGLFKRADFRFIELVPEDCEFVRGWDLAATEDEDAAATAGVLLARTKDQRIIIVDVAWGQLSPAKTTALLASTAQMDHERWGDVRGSIPQDPGQAGKVQVNSLITGPLFGFSYTASPESGDKEARAWPFAAQVEQGNVYLLRAPWNEAFIEEAVAFPNGKLKDRIDAASRAFSLLVPANKKKAGVAW